MPDATQIPTDEAPPPEDGWRPDLLTLRTQLDALDDKIHDLLMDRALVVESVARSGKQAAFRPGREAAILRRLLARHRGKLPPQTLVRMWRELLAGTTAMQTAVTVAVYEPTPDAALAELAREHFGFLTPAIRHPSAQTALQAVRDGAASVAVLPFPGAADPWWTALTVGERRLHIIARLPFWADRQPHIPGGDALVVGAAAPDASGNDRSFILLHERARLADAGLVPLAVHGAVSEVAGLLTDDDPVLPEGAIVLGGYAVPVAREPA